MKNNKIFVIAACLLAVLLLLCGCGDKNNENSADVSVNNEVSEPVSYTSTDEVLEEESVPEESIPAEHTHEYADAWSSNETDHWHECECGDKFDIANHTFGEWITTKEATEAETGSKKRTCSVCAYEDVAIIPMISHIHDYAKEWFNNETDHWHECKCGDKSDITSHTYGVWTITKEATEETEGSKYHICTVCEYKETVTIPVLSHTHSFGDWKNNDTSHWKECKCGDKSQLSAHTYGEWITVTEATCTTTGTKKHTCTACGYSETATISVIAHTYGDWKSNATSHWKECKCGNKYQLSTHNFGVWEIITETTCTTIGTIKHTCTACSYSETANINASGHNYGDWENDSTNHWKECTKCGNVAQKEGHNYTSVVTPPTDADQGYTTHTCDECGYSYVDSYVNSITTYSEGLEYEVSNKETCIILGIGTCKDTKLRIPPVIDGYKVTIIAKNAFYQNDRITSVTIPDSVTEIGERAFFGSRITNIDIPCSVTRIEYGTFSNCSNLTSVTIPDSVTYIGTYAFERCISLTSVTIPDSVTDIGYNAFERCTNLTSVTIPNSLTRICGGVFQHCTNLDSVTIPSSVTEIGEYAFFNSGITYINIPNSVTIIGDGAFRTCTNLTSVTISDSVTSISGSMFAYCDKLTSIAIPHGVTTINPSAFLYCTSLESITVPGSLTSVSHSAFDKCTSLTTVYYSASEDDWEKIDIGMFNGGLTNATIHYNMYYCKITISAGNGGSIAVKNNAYEIENKKYIYVPVGESITLVFEPNANYKLDTVKVGGKTVQLNENNEYTIKCTDTAGTVSATFRS